MYSAQSTPEELLHAFIDDELDTELEQQFYTLLASDGDLRNRLRQLRAIRGEARRFGAFTAPSQELTGAVFSRLGFAHSQTVNRNVFGAALLLRSAWSPVASAAAAAIITATLIFGLSDQPKDATLPRLADKSVLTNSPSESPMKGLGAESSDPASVASADRTTNLAQAASADRVADADESAGADRSGSRHLAMSAGLSGAPDFRTAADAEPLADARPRDTGLDPAGSGDELRSSDGSVGEEARTATPVTTAEVRRAQQSDDVATAPTASYVEVPDSWASADADRESGVVTSGAPSNTAAILASQGLPGAGILSREPVDTRKYFPSLEGGPGLQHVSIELRGVSAASFPDVTIGSRSQPWMENMAVALYYSNEQDDFGLEYGQEPFSQHYHGVEYGKAVRYEQNLLTSWLLAGYRHRFEPWRMLGSVEPYFSAGLGSTMQAWPLARAGAGFMYMPDRRVRFHIGLEGTLLAYPYQDTWFTSKRAGLTYGISVLL